MNLATLMHAQPDQRPSGMTSVRRLLRDHMLYHEERLDAGIITESTFDAYKKIYRHFDRWFPEQGYLRLKDIKRTSLQKYALDRVNKDNLKIKSVNQEVIFLRMWWSWLQSTEVTNRQLDVPKLKERVSTRSNSEPCGKGYLQLPLDTIDEWANDDSAQVSKYNRLLFQCFINLLEQSGCRTHEVLELTWNDISVGKTNDAREMIANTLTVPLYSKRGTRQCIFRGDALVVLRNLYEKYIHKRSQGNYIFRNQQTITLSTGIHLPATGF